MEHMVVRRVTREFYELENGQVVWFPEPLKNKISKTEMQKIVDRGTELVRSLQDVCKD